MLLLVVSGAPAPAEPRPSGLFDRVRRLLDRAEPDPLPGLTPAWQRPRDDLAAVEVSDSQTELTLRFTDGSSLSVDAPLAHLL